MFIGLLIQLLLCLSGLAGVASLIWCVYLAFAGRWGQVFLILISGSIFGLLGLGLCAVLVSVFGEAPFEFSAGVYVAIFTIGFSWASLATAISLGLWPFIVQLIGQSRRWVDRR